MMSKTIIDVCKLYAAFAEDVKAFLGDDKPEEDFYMIAGDNWLVADMLRKVAADMDQLRAK